MAKPEVQFVAIRRADGGVAIMQFVTDDHRGVVREATDEAIAIEIARTAIDHQGWRRIDQSELPEDRTFRDAWVDTGKIEIDMPKAREIKRDIIRRARQPLLEALDVEFQRAYKDPAAQDAIEAQKQALRDAPADPAIDAAKTPEQLKAVLPKALADSSVAVTNA